MKKIVFVITTIALMVVLCACAEKADNTKKTEVVSGKFSVLYDSSNYSVEFDKSGGRFFVKNTDGQAVCDGMFTASEAVTGYFNMTDNFQNVKKSKDTLLYSVPTEKGDEWHYIVIFDDEHAIGFTGTDKDAMKLAADSLDFTVKQ